MPREPARLKGCAEGWPAKLRQGKVKVCLGPLRAATAVLSASRDSGAALDRGSDSAAASEQASEPASAADAPGRDPAARMTARGAAGRCPPTVSDDRGRAGADDRRPGAPRSPQPGRAGCSGVPAAAAGSGFFQPPLRRHCTEAPGAWVEPDGSPVAAPGTIALSRGKGKLCTPLHRGEH
jgi:hypothetical protein